MIYCDPNPFIIWFIKILPKNPKIKFLIKKRRLRDPIISYIGNLRTIWMMSIAHHTIKMFLHMKKIKTAIGSCSMGKHLSKKSSKIMYLYMILL